jgi:hypothetical protein
VSDYAGSELFFVEFDSLLFQIICFDQNEELCIPTNADRTDYSKYALARLVIFRHLTHNLSSSNEIVVKRFASFTDAIFVRYLKESGSYFAMCHDGATPDTPELEMPRSSGIKNGLQTHAGHQVSVHATANPVTSSCAERIRKVNLRAMILWFIGNMYNVALINELQCTDSKVNNRNVLSR